MWQRFKRGGRMEIKSNKTFECYETAFESWSNNGKSIILDGQLLIPMDKVKQAKEEIDDLDRYFDNDYFSSNRDSMFKCSEVLEILDKLIESEEQMTKEEINTMKYKVCCPMCDNKKCVRGTDKCEAEIWAKSKLESEEK